MCDFPCVSLATTCSIVLQRFAAICYALMMANFQVISPILLSKLPLNAIKSFETNDSTEFDHCIHS